MCLELDPGKGDPLEMREWEPILLTPQPCCRELQGHWEVLFHGTGQVLCLLIMRKIIMTTVNCQKITQFPWFVTPCSAEPAEDVELPLL